MASTLVNDDTDVLGVYSCGCPLGRHDNANNSMRSVAGGSTLTDSQMERCVERAFQRHAEVRKLITVATHSHRHNTGSGA